MFMARVKILPVLFAALATALIWSVPVAAQAEVKLAVVDLNRCVRECKQGKRSQAELQRRAQDFENELKSLQTEVSTMQKELENTAMLLKPEARQAKERDFERKVRRLRDRQREAKQDMMEAQRDAFRPILNNLGKVIKQIGAQGKYTMITESKAALYYPSSVDITSQVIAAYDKAHP
ncbi:hypothetical protein X474_16600 [Dethiosulfatarculus sandiegensis]|uniref:OmpH family outer membrane protein n=2 Tax=Dethiosulfatarculus sandiegensis TaxID=1429043 RepID=A0A0D2JTV9_9BACT|nr:hypothetical protein X474_16600 [Dethiosulfatarculus sandiegensis]